MDDRPPRCLACRQELSAATLLGELERDPRAEVRCDPCGAAVPLRRPGKDRKAIHSSVVAVLNETAPRGDLSEPDTGEQVLFACLGCGASLRIDGNSPRISTCEYCDATNYLPDALWLRLHPAQRKRAFHLLLRANHETIAKASKRIR